MEIKVITRHAPSNYGSLLQSIATIKVLNTLGHDCQIIDYIRDDEKGLGGVLTALKQKPSWYNNPFKRLLYILVRYPEQKWEEMQFEQMRKKFLNLTPRYSSLDELKEIKAHIFMTGSDQVWGPLLNGSFDPAYFLSFVKNEKCKIAYAASFGRTDFSPNIIQQYQKLLNRYHAISVREDSAVKTLKDMGISSVHQVLDPTLLLTKEQWLSMAKPNQNKGNYVLAYQIHNDKKFSTYAKQFATYVGMPLYRISPSLHQMLRGGQFVYLPSVAKFLSFINSAKYIVTDSFHGTCFSINFNKNFIEILPNTKTGSRNQSILKLTGLEDRIVTNLNDFSIAHNDIDYNRVNTIISEHREQSIKILNEMLHINSNY